MLIGREDGTIAFFENGSFIEKTGIENPFNGLGSGAGYYYAHPSLVDMDGDGDLDLFYGNDPNGNAFGGNDSFVLFYENTNTPPTLTANASSLAYTENDGPVPVDASLSITDDDLNLISARISISANFAASEDALAFTNQSGITGAFDSSTGVLDLTVFASLTDYETAIGTVTYENTSNTPSELPRTLTFVATDQDATNFGVGATRIITVTGISGVNSAPVISTTAGSSVSYTENDPPLPVDNAVDIMDNDNTNLSSAAISISMNYTSGQDLLAFTNQAGISGSFDGVTGVLTLLGTALVADYQTAVRSVTYENTSEDPSSMGREISVTVNDGTDNSNTGTRTIQVVPVNDQPTLASTNDGTSLASTENDAPAILNNNFTMNDLDNTAMVSARVRFVNSTFVLGEDVLEFIDQNGILGSYDANTGTLNLTGTAPIADYITALESVTYENTSDDPDNLLREIDFQVDDGIDNSNAITNFIQGYSCQRSAGSDHHSFLIHLHHWRRSGSHGSWSYSNRCR